MDTAPLRRYTFAILLVLAGCGGGGGASGSAGGGGVTPTPTPVEVLRARALGLELQVQSYSADTPCDNDSECRVAAIDPQTGCQTPRVLPYSARSAAAASAASAAADLVEINRQIWWQEHPNTACPAVILPLPLPTCSTVDHRCATRLP